MIRRCAMLCLATALSSWPLPARGSTERFAVVIGNNSASGEPVALRFAEDDASKVARVLTELGGVAPEDLHLLRGQGMAEIRAALGAVKQRIAARHREPGSRALLLFYFSGHSDGIALEPAGDRFAFDELRRALADTGADIRVAIIDSCRSGALLAAKGLKPGPSFEMRLSDDLPSEGLVLLTSSAADEQALESSEIGGSYFTHHFLSGLRGAADTSGDGRITLAEAYQYAYTHTVMETARTLVGPQHPAYDYRVSGTGEIVLTETREHSAAIILPPGFDRALVADRAHNEVLAEVPGGAPRQVAVARGNYVVMLWKNRRAYTGQLVIGSGSRSVSWSELAPAEGVRLVAAKGSTATSVELQAGQLDRAIGLFRQLDDGAANAFKELLSSQPAPRIAARAHVYLGLLALNALDTTRAAEEFRQALRVDSITELPPQDSSPKAEVIFAQAKAQLAKEAIGESNQGVAAAGPTADLKLEPLAAQAPTNLALAGPSPEPVSHHSHWLSFSLGGGAVAAAAVSVYGGVQVLNYIGMTNAAKGQVNASQVPGAESTANVWRSGWIVCAAASAALLGGAILTW